MKPRALWALALVCLCLLPQCRLEEPAPAREENYVTVRLHDSLKHFDSVEIVILAGGDTNAVVGKVWTGALPNPKAVPSFKLPEGEGRTLSVRVRGFDSSGRLTLNYLISKQDGAQVIADLPLPVPPVVVPPVVVPPIVPPDTTPPVVIPPRTSVLKELSISPGTMIPAWDSSKASYLVQLAYAESTLTFNALPQSAGAVVRVGIDTIPNGSLSQPFSLKVGDNALSLISSIDGRETRYAILVKRASPPNPDSGFTGDKSSYSRWKYRTTVFVDLKALDMNRTWSETSMPLLLRLTKENFDFSQATYNGRDIRFARPDGISLQYEIARWEPEYQRAEIWIKSDELRVSDDSVKYFMYWGSTSAKGESDGRRVFIRGEDHTAVYHLAEQGNGTRDEFRDAMGVHHGQGGDGNGRDVPARVEAIVGYGQDFDPAPGSVRQTAIGLPNLLDPGTHGWTFQTWIKRTGDGDMTLFQKGDDWIAGLQRFELFIEGGGGGRLGVQREGAETMSGVYIPGQTWVHLAVAYTGARYDIYIDGWLRETHGWSQGGYPLGDCVLGAFYSDGTQGMRGILDEVWIGSKPRTPMWMRMTFENQKPGSTLVILKR